MDFKSLTAMLPTSLPGMKRTDAQKARMQGAVGVTTTSAKADYQGNDGADVHVEISRYLRGVEPSWTRLDPWSRTRPRKAPPALKETRSSAARSVHEKYDAKAKKGDLSVIVAKRFEVDVAGDGVDMNTLEQSLSQVDLARLESMKDQGAQVQ